MAMRCRDQSQQDYTVQARTGPRRPLTASLARCQGGRTACLPEEHQDRLGRQARVPARRGRHDFNSIASELAGKCASPCGESRVGTSEWLGGRWSWPLRTGIATKEVEHERAHRLDEKDACVDCDASRLCAGKLGTSVQDEICDETDDCNWDEIKEIQAGWVSKPIGQAQIERPNEDDNREQEDETHELQQRRIEVAGRERPDCGGEEEQAD